MMQFNAVFWPWNEDELYNYNIWFLISHIEHRYNTERLKQFKVIEDSIKGTSDEIGTAKATLPL